MGICAKQGCSNPIFSHSYCRIHQWMRTDDAYKKAKEYARENRRTKKPISLESKTRKKEHPRYTEVCERLTEEIKAENGGKIYCFFSGLEITGKPIFHHLKGRIGDYYTDKELLVPALNKYHNMYHFAPIEDLMKEDWYASFLSRLRKKDYSLYLKEQKKMEKAQNYLDFS